MIKRRDVMVMNWVQNCEEYRTSKTSGYDTNSERRDLEDPQNPETSDYASKRQKMHD